MKEMEEEKRKSKEEILLKVQFPERRKLLRSLSLVAFSALVDISAFIMVMLSFSRNRISAVVFMLIDVLFCVVLIAGFVVPTSS